MEKMATIFDTLNAPQIEAVQTIDGPVLILAGAGSGKTKTVTSRVAYLIANGIHPSSILTLTFTNKAANEMRHRALSLIDSDISYTPLLCTFHKFGLLFLKHHINHLNRSNSFVIIDSDDKKRIIKSFDVDLPIPTIASEISRFKNNLMTPERAISGAQLPNYKKIAAIYKQYDDYLKQNNLVDFEDLLALPYQILEQNPTLAREISQKYQYIMVDEYQDTNDLQFKLLEKLTTSHKNLCVVGDDDQSIYGWRGANIKNILEFNQIFPNTKTIKLEKNYRSTNNILKVANSLIEHNRTRLGKVLIGTKEDGKEITIIHSQDENAEAHIIANHIKKLILTKKVNPKEIAIIYRINALSRSLEESFNRNSIPYKMVGGLKFYERAEIKDIISYLRLISNVHDNFSIKRVINKPKRGIGKATIDKLSFGAKEKNCSIFSFITNNLDEIKDKITKKAFTSLISFSENILKIKESLDNEPISELMDRLEESFKIRAYYESLPNSLERVLNIEEFYALFKDFMQMNDDASLDIFLNEISLRSDQDQIDDESVSLMSIHASKGLEFEHIFVIGLEEGFFPLIGDGNDIEEERRLAYVAFTRAKDELTLSSSASRFYRGKRAGLLQSRFLAEAGVVKGSLKLEKTTCYKKGTLVKHKLFGIGRVLGVNKIKREYMLKINFSGKQRDILASFVEKI